MLKPGDQATTDASLVKTAVTDEVGWSRDSARYVSLLGEFNAIKQGLDAVPSPALRYESKLLPYASSDTVLYAAIPNLSASLAEAQRLFNDRLQQSDVLRAWWEEQKDGAKLQEMMDSVRRFSDYLGNEVVFTVAGNGDGQYSEPVIMAEVKNAGLETFLTGGKCRNSQPEARRDFPRWCIWKLLPRKTATRITGAPNAVRLNATPSPPNPIMMMIGPVGVA